MCINFEKFITERRFSPQLPRADPTSDDDQPQVSEQEFELTTLTEIETTRTVSSEPKNNPGINNPGISSSSHNDNRTSSVNYPAADLPSNAELSIFDKIMEMENWELSASRTSLDNSDEEEVNTELVSGCEVVKHDLRCF